MSCTLEELQKTELAILCEFDDFCKKYNLQYVLDYGTLLGAVRHNGFIPWDDDIDITMNYKNFKKFIKLYRKHPISGLHLTWIDTEPEAPFPFAKLRRDGTHMPEDALDGIGLHDGVWIDIFAYIGAPKQSYLAMIQTQLYMNFILMTKMAGEALKDKCGKTSMKHTWKSRFLQKAPKWLIRLLRKFALNLVILFSDNKSENVIMTWWLTEKSKGVKRSYYEPITSHIFENREFPIPANYDVRLTKEYGDYMTPVVFDTHAHLDTVQLIEQDSAG